MSVLSLVFLAVFSRLAEASTVPAYCALSEQDVALVCGSGESARAWLQFGVAVAAGVQLQHLEAGGAIRFTDFRGGTGWPRVVSSRTELGSPIEVPFTRVLHVLRETPCGLPRDLVCDDLGRATASRATEAFPEEITEVKRIQDEEAASKSSPALSRLSRGDSPGPSVGSPAGPAQHLTAAQGSMCDPTTLVNNILKAVKGVGMDRSANSDQAMSDVVEVFAQEAKSIAAHAISGIDDVLESDAGCNQKIAAVAFSLGLALLLTCGLLIFLVRKVRRSAGRHTPPPPCIASYDAANNRLKVEVGRHSDLGAEHAVGSAEPTSGGHWEQDGRRNPPPPRGGGGRGNRGRGRGGRGRGGRGGGGAAQWV